MKRGVLMTILLACTLLAGEVLAAQAELDRRVGKPKDWAKPQPKVSVPYTAFTPLDVKPFIPLQPKPFVPIEPTPYTPAEPKPFVPVDRP